MPVIARTDKPAYARVMLIGSPGAGKTLFPSSLECCYLDIENRAGHTGRPRLLFTKDANGIQDIQNTVNIMARLKPDDEGMLTYKQGGDEIRFNTLVIDSLDEIQLMMDMGWPKGGDMRKWWGRALSVMQSIVNTAKTVNAHLFVIAHAKEYMPDEAQQKTGVFVPEVKLALAGQIRDRVPRWFDQILHMTLNPKSGNVGIFTQPQMSGGRFYLAKDATHVFGGKTLTVKFVNGKPNPEDVQKIVDSTDSGGDVSMFANPEAIAMEAEAVAAVQEAEAEEAFSPALIGTFDELFAQAAHRMGKYGNIEAVRVAMRDMTAADTEERSKAILRRFNFAQWWQKLAHWVPSDGKHEGIDKDAPDEQPDTEPPLPDLEDDAGADPDVGAEVEAAEAGEEEDPIIEVEGPVVKKSKDGPDRVRVALLQELPVKTRLYRKGTKLADILLLHDEEANGPVRDVLTALRGWDTDKPEHQPVKVAAGIICDNWVEAATHLSTPSYAQRPSAALPAMAPSDWVDFATFAVDALGFLTIAHFLTVVEAVEVDKGRKLRNSRGRKQVWEGVYERWIIPEGVTAKTDSVLDKALGRVPDDTDAEEKAMQEAGI